jgi:hypothetical protein
MYQNSPRIRYNLAGLLIGVVGFVAVVIYGSISLAAQDPVWFLTSFNEKPIRVIVYNTGKKTVLEPGQPGFTEVSTAILSSLNLGVARQSGIGLSEGSLQDAYTKFETVEVFYSHPVKLHAPFSTHLATQMLFPITGRHSELAVVFLGYGGNYMSDSPALNSTEPISKALSALGL